MTWTIKHIESLKAAGKIRDFVDMKAKPISGVVKSKDKISYGKLFIEAHLNSIWKDDKICELEFAKKKNRKFRFDWANEKLMIAVEYEGIYSAKSGHTTHTGYNKDTIKYNLAASLGWVVYRYTAANFKNIINDLTNKNEYK